MDKEYLMLREEILHLDTVINNTINFFYVFIASFLAFSLTQKDTIFIVLSYIITIPAYIIVQSEAEGMCKIGSYLCVFHEGNQFNWEFRNYKFNRKYNSHIYTFMASANFPFVFVNIGVLIIYLYRAKKIFSASIYVNCKTVLCIILFLAVFAITYKSTDITQKKYIERWKALKKVI